MEKSGFFNSVGGDRKYKAEDWANYFKRFVTNGIFPVPSTNLQVMANSDMTITVKAGAGWINGYIYENTSELILPVDAADGVLSRIDRVALKYDTVAREIKAIVKKGSFSSSPVAPALQRDSDAYELGIADISIAAGAASIEQVNITDIRLNTELCGIVNSLIQADTTTLLNQYESGMQSKMIEFQDDFEAWFATLQDVLDEDTAGNLLNLINANSAALTDHEEAADPHEQYALDTDLATLQGEVTSHKAECAVLIPKSGSTANAIILDIVLTDKKKGSFRAAANNTGNMTINGKPFKKDAETEISADGVKAGKVYDFYYDGTADCVFILAKASGTAQPSDVLAGETFSNDDGEQIGTARPFAEIPYIAHLIESIGYGGDIRAIVYDGTYIYMGGITTKTVWKIDPTNMSKVSESTNYGGNIMALACDGTYLYVGGDTTKKVWKIDPTNMSKVSESANYGDTIKTIACDGAYLYVGGDTTNKVWKIDPTNMSKVSESVDYGGTIQTIACDGAYLYVGGYASQKIWKIDPTNMSKVTESISYGGNILSLAYDGTYLYVGGTTTNKVWKIDPTNMSKVAESISYGPAIWGIVCDGTYLYVGGTTTNKVWKIDPTNMSKVAESADYGGNIFSLAYDGTYLYVGGATTKKVWKALGAVYVKEVLT